MFVFLWRYYNVSGNETKKQELSQKEAADILHKGTSGVLALLGDNNYPYAVPVNYIFDHVTGKEAIELVRERKNN